MDVFDLAAGFMAFGIVAILLGLVVGLVVYILTSLGLYKYLKMMNHQYAYAAWIPFWGMFCAAQTVPVDEEKRVTLFGTTKVPQLVLCLYWLIGWCLNFIPVIGAIAGVVVNFGGAFIIYKSVYARIEGTQESEVVGKAVVTTLFPFVLFFAMNKYNKTHTAY